MGSLRGWIGVLALPVGLALLPVTGVAATVVVPTSLPVPTALPTALPTLPPVPAAALPAAPPAALPAVAVPPAPTVNPPLGAAPAAVPGPSTSAPGGDAGAGPLPGAIPARGLPPAGEGATDAAPAAGGLTDLAGTGVNAAAPPATLNPASPGPAETICPKLVLAAAPGCPAVLDVVTSLARSGLQFTWGAAGLLLALFGWILLRRSRSELSRRPPAGR